MESASLIFAIMKKLERSCKNNHKESNKNINNVVIFIYLQKWHLFISV